MNQNKKSHILLAFIIAVVAMVISLGMILACNYFLVNHSNQPQIQIKVQNQNNSVAANSITIDSLKNATLSYPDPYDESKNDTVNLVNGHTLLYDAGNIKPRAYDVGATAVGDLNGDGIPDGVVGVYQSFGANRITPIVFAFLNENAMLNQVDYVLPDSSDWNDETQIKSLSINNGIISVNLLILSPAEQSLPHYQQQPTVEKTIQYKLLNGKLIISQPVQSFGCSVDSDCRNGALCLVTGPLIDNQPVHKVCVQKDQVIPL